MNANGNPQVMDYQQAQAGYHTNAEARRDARGSLETALQEKAQAEHDYRKALSVAFAKHRAKQQGMSEAEIHAKADAAGFALARDMADARAKGAQARLAELEGERASLRQLIDWGREAVGS